MLMRIGFSQEPISSIGGDAKGGGVCNWRFSRLHNARKSQIHVSNKSTIIFLYFFIIFYFENYRGFKCGI
jgi:hypothetical protein